MANLVSNELLCFISTQYDKLDKDTLFSVTSEYYTFDESTIAKQIIIEECDKLSLEDAILEF